MNPHTPCVAHLHLEGISAAPGIDGNSSIGLGVYSSTNSTIGKLDAFAAAIRAAYLFIGAVLGGSSWAAVGWTADWTGSQADCGSVAYCRLYTHYAPNPVVGHWGGVQVFRLHAGAAITDDNAIMSGRFTNNTPPGTLGDPYWVKKGYFTAWIGGFVFTVLLGMPIAADGPCPPDTLFPWSYNCAGYQRFNFGYVWKDNAGTYRPVRCPSVAPAYPYEDNVVDSFNDIFSVAFLFGDAAPSAPYVPWSSAQFDLDGGGDIDLFNDIIGVANEFGDQCWPGGMGQP